MLCVQSVEGGLNEAWAQGADRMPTYGHVNYGVVHVAVLLQHVAKDHHDLVGEQAATGLTMAPSDGVLNLVEGRFLNVATRSGGTDQLLAVAAKDAR